MDCLDYLKELIKFKSITPESAGSVEYIESILKAAGFKTIVKVFGEEGYKTTNLYARHGGGSPNICFAGHLDVVPPGNLDVWGGDPFEPLEENGYIRGRGAVDMKGGVACLLASAFDFLKANPKPSGSVSFLLTTDEEGSAEYGLKLFLPYLKDLGESADFVLLGEPSSKEIFGDQIKTGRRGSINFKLTVKGTQGHVAYPERAENPLPLAALIATELDSLEFEKDSPEKGFSNLELTSIDAGNEVVNIIPGKVGLAFNVRFSSAYAASEIVCAVEEKVKIYAENYDFSYKITALPFYLDRNKYSDKLVEAVEEVTGVKPSYACDGGTSDARFIKDYFPVAEFGLLSGEAHKVGEKVEIIDLQRLYKVYYLFLRKTLG